MRKVPLTARACVWKRRRGKDGARTKRTHVCAVHVDRPDEYDHAKGEEAPETCLAGKNAENTHVVVGESGEEKIKWGWGESFKRLITVRPSLSAKSMHSQPIGCAEPLNNIYWNTPEYRVTFRVRW